MFLRPDKQARKCILLIESFYFEVNYIVEPECGESMMLQDKVSSAINLIRQFPQVDPNCKNRETRVPTFS